MRFYYVLSAAAIVFACAYQPVGADIIALNAVTEFSSGTSPIGPIPWVVATFDDLGGQGTVNMTLRNTNLTANEFVSEWYLNLDPSLNAGSLTFAKTGGSGSFIDPGISTGTDAFKAGGDGNYDIRFSFATNDGLPTRFTTADSVTYQITGIPTLTAQSFAWPSDSNQPNKQFYMAAHVQGIGPNSLSGWVAATGFSTAPEPSSVVLLVLGLLGLSLLRRREKA